MSAATSLLPIDCGFDPKAHGMPVDISDVNYVRFERRDGKIAEVRGNKLKIARALIEAGFACVVVEYLPNDCEIRMVRSRRFANVLYEVQSRTGSGGITTKTLDDAREAYWHPERYRQSHTTGDVPEYQGRE